MNIQISIDDFIKVLSDFFVPIIIAIITYIVVDRIGEWKKRRNTCLLGISIIESLQEEVRHGIGIMKLIVKILDDTNSFPLGNLLPNKSWSGMNTIPDDVLLRILITSKNINFKGFKVKDIRIHCKNYFEHMNENYNNHIKVAILNAKKMKNWQHSLKQLLLADGKYLEAAEGVYKMLEDAKILLQKNAKRIIPK